MDVIRRPTKPKEGPAIQLQKNMTDDEVYEELRQLSSPGNYKESMMYIWIKYWVLELVEQYT